MGLRIEQKGTLRLLGKGDDLPYELLLLPDETIDAIDRYVYDSEVYLFELDHIAIAAFVLKESDEGQIEIKNIAVAANYQGNGIGSFLLQKACEIAIKKGFGSILIGTGDQSLRPLALYEKVGFERYKIIPNFFPENYPAPIYENGMQLKDMIVLKKNF